MNRLGFLGLIGIVFLVASGCIGGPKSPALSIASNDAPVPAGIIAGTVMDDEQRPVENVTVTVRELKVSTATDAVGAYLFDGVPVGRYTLEADHPRFNTTVKQVEAHAAKTTRASLTVVLRPEFKPLNFTRSLDGQLECAAEYVIITGACWTVVEGTSCDPKTVNHCVADPYFKSKYEFPIEIGDRWDSIIAELTWESGSDTMPGMHLYLENANVTGEAAHGKKVAVAEGEVQPLKLRVDRGTVAAGAEKYTGTNVDAFIPDRGGAELLRVFPMGHAHEYTGLVCDSPGHCFLGVGAALDLKFTIHLTLFYNGRAPQDFTAVVS